MSKHDFKQNFPCSSQESRSTPKLHGAVIDNGAKRSIIGYAQAKAHAEKNIPFAPGKSRD
jgi:hypothetical protein